MLQPCTLLLLSCACHRTLQMLLLRRPSLLLQLLLFRSPLTSAATLPRPAAAPASHQAASRKRSTSTTTPASKAAAGRTSSIHQQQPPSSAGHTPMDRFSCGSKATPQQGFPGFTPPPTAGGDGGTPSAKLGLFRTASKDSRGVERATPSPLPGGSGSAAALEQLQQQRLDSLTPDSRAKAVLQGALDLTPAAEGAKAGE